MHAAHTPAATLGFTLLLAVAGAAAAGELADPTRPPDFDAAPPVVEPAPLDRSQWTLSLVKISAARRSAVINGRVVRVGEEVDGARVVGIDPRAVQLEKAGERFELRLAEAGVKSPDAGAQSRL